MHMKKTPKNKLLKFCRIEVILIPQEAREKIARNKKKGNIKGISIDFGQNPLNQCDQRCLMAFRTAGNDNVVTAGS